MLFGNRIGIVPDGGRSKKISEMRISERSLTCKSVNQSVGRSVGRSNSQ